MEAMHRRSGSVVDQEREQFGARIVADGIHHPLALDDQRHVEIGDQDALTRRERLHHMAAIRGDDCGHAAAAQAGAQAFIR